jgi:hypothetical protein
MKMTAPALTTIRSLVEKLEAARGRPVVLYHSAITFGELPALYECLRRAGQVTGLDLVLSTSGGTITSTRQIAMLLREFTGHLTILVPYKARSAGTLLCLGADQLVLGPLAELGPLDSVMDSVSVPPPDAPGTISAEDIRAFRSMAEDWFGVSRPADRLQVLGLLATRIFPTSLSSFYRFDKLVREVAAELLAWQLPGDDHAAERTSIVNRLVSGYHSHDVALCRRDVQALGLRAVDATAQEEGILWELSQAVRSSPRQLVGAIVARDFSAYQRAPHGPAGTPADQPGAPDPLPDMSRLRWEIAD